MNSAIERLARILCNRDGHSEDVLVSERPMWVSYTGEARSLLLAIREPSDAMIVAGAECESLLVRDIYSAMIDAALAEDA
jgi:hypothetical protein